MFTQLLIDANDIKSFVTTHAIKDLSTVGPRSSDRCERQTRAGAVNLYDDSCID